MTDHSLDKEYGKVRTGDEWLGRRRENEGAEGLWRVRDELYDLSAWMKCHPGGSQWLELTKGTDITEAFETHHFSPAAETTLTFFHVKSASTPRYFPYAFERDGFYKTLKRRLVQELGTNLSKPSWKSILFMDVLTFTSLAACVCAAYYRSFILGSLAGILLALAGVCSHNFSHMSDNWRMYFLHVCFMSVRDWRLTHILSHHMFTNTEDDMEIVLFRPFLEWLPKSKPFVSARLFWIYTPFVFAFASIRQLLTRIVTMTCTKHDWLALLVPAIMSAVSPYAIVLPMWLWIIVNSSFVIVFIGMSAGHHHPDSYHEGDPPRKNRDWGLSQLDTVQDRPQIRGMELLSLISFGDHCLHHLFPTMDHCWLPKAYPIFEKTCNEFGVLLGSVSVLEAITGPFQQLALIKSKKKST